MNQTWTRLCILLIAASLTPGAAAGQDRTRTPGGAVADRTSRTGTQGESASGSAPEATIPIPPEDASVTKHDWTGGGATVHYTATAGNLLIKDEKDAVPTAASSTSPIQPMEPTRAHGRSPSSTTAAPARLPSGCTWVRWAPMRVVTASPDATGPAPVPDGRKPVQPASTASDLVFIDAPLTGFSRAVGKGTVKDFRRHRPGYSCL